MKAQRPIREFLFPPSTARPGGVPTVAEAARETFARECTDCHVQIETSVRTRNFRCPDCRRAAVDRQQKRAQARRRAKPREG